MESIQLEAFAKILVQKVRDSAAPDHAFRGTFDQRMSHAQHWRQLKEDRHFDELLFGVISEFVDHTLFHFLHQIDNGRLALSFVAESGDTHDLRELGRWEMDGWYASHTWTAKYSSTRYNNWFPDMPPEIEDMSTAELEEFSKLFIVHVRDEAIRACDSLLDPQSTNARARRWRELKEAGRIDDVLTELIPDCVDVTILRLLRAIDQGQLRLSFRTESGELLELQGLGLPERYARPGGWREQYTQKRYNPDISDLV